MLVIVVATAGYGAKMFKDTGVMQAYVLRRTILTVLTNLKNFMMPISQI